MSTEQTMDFISTLSRDATRYRLVDDLMSVSAAYLVVNDAGEQAFQINRRSLLEHDIIRLDDLHGNVLCQTATNLTRTTRTLALIDRSGAPVGCVQRQQLSPLRDQFSIELEGEPPLCIDGDVGSLEFQIAGTAGVVADVSRRWFRARNSYGVAIGPDQRDADLLTAILTIVQMSRRTS